MSFTFDTELGVHLRVGRDQKQIRSFLYVCVHRSTVDIHMVFFSSRSNPQQHQTGLTKMPKRANGGGVLTSNELGVQAFGLGNNGRNDLPGFPPEVFVSKYALPKVVLVHSSRSLGLAKAVARASRFHGGQRAADRAAIAKLRVRDQVGRLMEQWTCLAQRFGSENLGVRSSGLRLSPRVVFDRLRSWLPRWLRQFPKS
jgi:hypothetical protein